MASQAMQRLQHFNSQNISNTLWAFASLNHHPGPMLLKVLQRELVHKLRQFTPQGIENVLWAFATLGHHPGEPPPPPPPSAVPHPQPHPKIPLAAWLLCADSPAFVNADESSCAGPVHCCPLPFIASSPSAHFCIIVSATCSPAKRDVCCCCMLSLHALADICHACYR